MDKSKVLITGDSIAFDSKPIELFNKSKEVCQINSSYSNSCESVKKPLVDLGDKSSYPRRHIDFSWLSAASKIYNISEDISDYVVIPVPVLTSSIPNRNSQAFGLHDLLAFVPEQGKMAYQTFIGKGCFQNHVNSVLVNAKGVNIDTALIPIKRYGIAKIIVLSAFDRTKDRDMVNELLKGEKQGYSMGALARYFICSICEGILGPSVTRTCTCSNTDYTNLQSLGKIVKGKVHYHMAKEFTFIENSLINPGCPADSTAISDIIL